jgi:hypothetical protein
MVSVYERTNERGRAVRRRVARVSVRRVRTRRRSEGQSRASSAIDGDRESAMDEDKRTRVSVCAHVVIVM